VRFDKSFAALVVALVAVLGALGLGVLLLLPADERGELLRGAGAVIAPAVGTILAALAAAVAAASARASQRETRQQTPMLEQIKHQTNGTLSEPLARIEARLDAMTAGAPVELVDPAAQP
jgi:hypothetical protein